MTWDPEWGEPEDFNIVKDKDELDGYKVGHTVRLLEDGDEGGFEGDEGEIVGLSHTNAGLFGPDRWELIVKIDGMDPIAVPPEICEFS